MCSIGKHPRPPACGGLRGENRGFRTLNDAVLRASLIPTSRLLCIITCHTSSLFYVTACHMTRCIVKTAAPILFRAVVSSCKASQIFFHILILNAIRWIMYNAQIENRIKEEHNVPDVLGMRRPCVRAALLRAKRTARRKSCLSLFSNFSYSYLTSR